MLDFWSAICICHNLIVEGDAASGAFRYQGPSPDEVHILLPPAARCTISMSAGSKRSPAITSLSAVLLALCLIRSCTLLARPQARVQGASTASCDPRVSRTCQDLLELLNGPPQ